MRGEPNDYPTDEELGLPPHEGVSPEQRMQCPICERIITIDADENLADKGICSECQEALDKIEPEGLDETDAEMRKAIERYQKRQAYMQRYNAIPENKEKRKGYNDRRREKDKQLIARAKKLGLLVLAIALLSCSSNSVTGSTLACPEGAQCSRTVRIP